MARAGAAVVVAARYADALARVAAEIESEDGRAVVAPTDISQPEAVERLVATTVAALGGLDIAVNNAAGGDRRPAALEPPTARSGRRNRAPLTRPLP